MIELSYDLIETSMIKRLLFCKKKIIICFTFSIPDKKENIANSEFMVILPIKWMLDSVGLF